MHRCYGTAAVSQARADMRLRRNQASGYFLLSMLLGLFASSSVALPAAQTGTSLDNRQPERTVYEPLDLEDWIAARFPYESHDQIEGQIRASDQPHASEQPHASAAAALPNDCLSYKKRYKRQYHQGLVHSNVANALQPHSRYVVLCKLHITYSGKMPLDLVLNLRAMAAEVTAAGYHFYILLQPPTRDFYVVETVEKTRLTREEILACLPPDLRPFIVVHDHEEDFAAYPALGAHDDRRIDPTAQWGPGPRAAYVAISRFMQRYQGYEYVWVVESQARWTGSSWGEFLNAALDLGRQAKARELRDHPQRIVPAQREASVDLPDAWEGVPDLLTMRAVNPTTKFGELPHHMGDASQLWEMPAILFMGSRRFWNAVHNYSQHGIGCHIEVTLPTIAVEQRMKVAAVPLPEHPTYREPFHCCMDDAQKLYSEWFKAGTECARSLLLYPVRANEGFWPTMALNRHITPRT